MNNELTPYEMKIRVSYKATFDQEALDALAAYSGRRRTRQEIKSLLQDVGETGVDEMILEGRSFIEARKAREAGAVDEIY